MALLFYVVRGCAPCMAGGEARPTINEGAPAGRPCIFQLFS